MFKFRSSPLSQYGIHVATVRNEFPNGLNGKPVGLAIKILPCPLSIANLSAHRVFQDVCGGSDVEDDFSWRLPSPDALVSRCRFSY
ncbi:hypothetical protein Poly59_05680 [Rubripirellula reticaptiva]|uniref:Uncharacterized protein n=1 Tax=Rubripirellula reticaptiva TaxID=2528013 RepID=A0A5C6FDJ0_9BACT|nr:hypothetical protein Poly59_05680 [Rubripirellula reticaptiva]